MRMVAGRSRRGWSFDCNANDLHSLKMLACCQPVLRVGRATAALRSAGRTGSRQEARPACPEIPRGLTASAARGVVGSVGADERTRAGRSGGLATGARRGCAPQREQPSQEGAVRRLLDGWHAAARHGRRAVVLRLPCRRLRAVRSAVLPRRPASGATGPHRPRCAIDGVAAPPASRPAVHAAPTGLSRTPVASSGCAGATAVGRTIRQQVARGTGDRRTGQPARQWRRRFPRSLPVKG